MNKGRVWINWKKLNYTGELQSSINSTQGFILDLQSFSIKLPEEIRSYTILGKIGNESSISQVVEMLMLNENLLEKRDKVLLGLQAAKIITKDPTPI
ncbi:hypothetical protein O181_006383 [Austropuccinia psidii MF-1]|uniref:Uncharacterized protein n=1 Tax=Austropuccinia psidii MF-1 TaxID=1389203 RepID=A0A9Q3BK51_9BASI|nr:hypothetical protein [Austropuccinia psidii MF-1]